MKFITLTIVVAAVVSACAITPPQERTLSLEHSPRAVPAASTSDARREATPNVDLQIYSNPDLNLAALELGQSANSG
ncbi:MAG TPA: hypothetical protein VFS80_13960 [Burkholderiales bacterium]|nr:hypothetical protein [Burkholderiales bacterium]